MPACHSCGRQLAPEVDYGRQDTCAGCGRPTRVCMNCVNYDPSKYNECTEPVADRVVDKDKSTFCDFFKPGSRATATTGPSASELAKKAAEALFKKK